ncbi:hypothetical protein ACFSC4_09815 [Deinococcus malanensis]|uniref:hypothetical protein n=1 Tax=Deinococcus malanensis TaxID=1706855 RepID=UPI003627420D
MSGVPLFRRRLEEAANQALDPRREPTVVVLRADAGTGKTFSTLTVVLRRIHQGDLQRVLVAVRDTAQEQGLAAQTQQDLSTIAAGLQLPARPWSRIVRGRDALAEETSLDGEQLERAYRAQFAWTDDVPILIVSHAHLPLVMGNAPRKPQGTPAGAGPDRRRGSLRQLRPDGRHAAGRGHHHARWVADADTARRGRSRGRDQRSHRPPAAGES